MDLGLEGKNAIVTGGSLGIGSAIALTLAQEGCNVALNYRRHDTEAKEIVAEIEKMGRKGLAVKADVSSYADAENMVQTVVKEWGSLDILVPLDAGVQIRSESSFLSSIDIDDDDFYEVEDDLYESDNFGDTKKELIFDIEVGLGSIEVEYTDR